MTIKGLSCLAIAVLVFSTSAFAETIYIDQWRDTGHKAYLVEKTTIDGDGTFTISWSSPAMAYDDGFKIYYAPPSGESYSLDRSTSSSNVTYSNLDLGRHKFAIECMCYDDEEDDELISKWVLLTVEVGESLTVVPNYKIVSMIYAPPGSTNGGRASTITYAESSSFGSSTTASDTFKRDISVVSSVSGLLGSFSISSSFSASQSNWSQEVLQTTKNLDKSLELEGPRSTDGVNHNDDQIVLWLNPRVEILSTPTATEWKFEQDQEISLLYVYVGALKDPSIMPSGTALALESAGITEDVYMDILAAYPFEYEGTPLDLERFKYVDTITYQPPLSPGGSTTTSTLKLDYESSTIDSSSVTKINSYGVDVTATFGEKKVWESISTLSSKWTWTDVDSRKNTEGTSESTNLTIRGPAYGYSGSTSIKVYYDVIYKTFAFIPL